MANSFFIKNHKLVYKEWLDPLEIKGSTVLDLGCQWGWLGEYCILNSVKEYVGVDIDKDEIDQAIKSYPELSFINMNLEDYVEQCVEINKKFDIIVISRTIHGIPNLITLLQKLSIIGNKIVIESGVPVNLQVFELLEILKNTNFYETYQDSIDKIVHNAEYNSSFIGCLSDEKFIHLVPSIKFFEDIFEKLGFKLDLTSYESAKNKFPTEYGYGSRPESNIRLKFCILKFTKVTDKQKPLSWKEWHDLGGRWDIE
jgi:trans-aconitate methyltransferase